MFWTILNEIIRAEPSRADRNPLVNFENLAMSPFRMKNEHITKRIFIPLLKLIVELGLDLKNKFISLIDFSAYIISQIFLDITRNKIISQLRSDNKSLTEPVLVGAKNKTEQDDKWRFYTPLFGRENIY